MEGRRPQSNFSLGNTHTHTEREREREREREEEETRRGEEEARTIQEALRARRATISLRASNFYDEATGPGRANTRGDQPTFDVPPSAGETPVRSYFAWKVDR